MNDKQKIVEVTDQFALKNASDETLRKILPSYRLAIERITDLLGNMPEGDLERDLWLRTQLATIERQFQPVADRINAVLPPAEADQFMRAMDNAADFLKADDIRPGPVPKQKPLVATTTGGQQVTQTGNLFDLGVVSDPSLVSPTNPAGEFITPAITRQQIEAASRSGGFSTFTLDKQQITLDQVLPEWRKAQAANLEKVLRTGFLSGQSNQEIMRQFGPLGPGRRGWAMTEAVVRTGMAEASQAAHDAFFDANEDLLPKVPGGYRWEWDATNDTRLCPECAPLDGRRFKTRDEMPAKPHWGCRCKKLPITATMAQMRADGDVPSGSFLERRPVTYTNGKMDPPPKGWDGRMKGGQKVNQNAYARPQRQGYKTVNGKKKPEMYWVRRKDLPKGRNTAGDMLKNTNRDSREQVLGSKKMADKWDEMIVLPKYANDPQSLVVKLLGSGNMGGRPPQRPRRN